MYLYLRYNFTGILLLVSIVTIGSSVDLNITVRDLRDIPCNWVDLKKSLKNSWGGAFREYSAGERAFGS
jgi:hypothetical protein